MEMVFSLPDQKAEFSDQNLSGILKLFTSSTSSVEPPDQFQPNLPQCILGWRGIKYAEMKGNVLFPGQIMKKL